MRLQISFLLIIIILSGAYARPTHSRQAGDFVRIKPKDLTPLHDMGNPEGLRNNHHGIILGTEENGKLRVTHVSSNPPPPNIHVHSVVRPGGSVGLTGKMHVGHSSVDTTNVKNSNKFTGQQLSAEQVEKIKLAGKLHPVVRQAAEHSAKRDRHS